MHLSVNLILQPDMEDSAADYQSMYNSFGSLDVVDGSQDNLSNSEYPGYFVDDWYQGEESAFTGFGLVQAPVHHTNEITGYEENYNQLEETSTREGGRKVTAKAIKEKVAFKTRSDVEILDDGFKWRKYGKKMVKNSPNPRNYYKCSIDKCPVKKRVERDREDQKYVITTYEGVHNHSSPSGY